MAPRQIHLRLADKAASALVSAIEIYNKPGFEYREETFCLLALNGWEVLLKARIVQLSGGDVRSIYVYGSRQKKAGGKTTKKFIQRTAARTAKTISLHNCLSRLDGSGQHKLPEEVKANLLALSEVRDASAHFITASSVLRTQVLEIAVAAVKNFVLAAKEWFDLDLSEDLSLILPLAFTYPSSGAESVTVGAGEGMLIEYLRNLAKSQPPRTGGYDVAVNVEVRLKRSNLTSATRVQVVDDPSAPAVTLAEQDIAAMYPWTYEKLTAELAKRYSDFSQNKRYHQIRKSLVDDQKYAWIRLLDPGNPASGQKQFFSQAILREFDKHYTKRE